ncbi:MAG: hypothetical protein COB24_09015 [Hyphomicrobiales bacterium]|nr:MAG: hypothetical protein COB24_09015 [Hyphomicrobiales bacterium]
MPEFVYSANGETYHVELQLVAKEFVSQGYNDGQIVTIFRAEKINFKHKDVFPHSSVDSMVCEISESVEFHFEGNSVEKYLKDMDGDKVQQLEQHILNWFDKNIAQPEFWSVENIKEFEIKFNQNDLSQGIYEALS